MRYTFGGAASDFAITAPSLSSTFVKAAVSQVGGTAWSARTGGTQYTDLIAVDGGAPVRTDADGWIQRFQGPDGITELWVAFGASARFLLRTSDALPFLLAPVGTIQTTNHIIALDETVTVFNGSGLTATLPAASAVRPWVPYTVRNSHTTPLIVVSAGGTLDGIASVSLAQTESLVAVSDGTNWITTAGVRRATFNVRKFGAKGDGTDDTVPIQAALDAASAATGGTVECDWAVYGFAGVITVPDGVHLVGQGNVSTTGGGTILKALASDAKVWTRGTGSGLRNIYINGNFTAAIPLQSGGTAAGDAGSDGYFQNVQVAAGTTRNWSILTVQNATFINCRSNITGPSAEGILIDNGVGGCVFIRCESNSAQAGPNWRIGPNAATSGFPTSNNTFIGCQGEFRADNGPELKIEGGFSNTFVGGAFYHAAAGHTAPIAEISGNTRTYFDGTVFAGNADKLRVGMKVGPGVSILSRSVVCVSNIRGFGVSEYFDISAANAAVLMSGPATGLNADEATGINLLTAGTPKVNIGQDNQWPTNYRMTAVGDAILTSLVAGGAFARLSVLADGLIAWGSGSSASADVSMTRTAAGVLTLTGRLLATAGLGSGATTTAGRLSAPGVGVGVMMYDTTLSKPIWSDGTVWRDAAGTAV